MFTNKDLLHLLAHQPHFGVSIRTLKKVFGTEEKKHMDLEEVGYCTKSLSVIQQDKRHLLDY